MEEGSHLKLIMEKGPLEGEIREFKPRSVIRIGRVVRGNTLAVKDAGISSKHISIEFKSGKWVLLDLDSSNGTVLNGIKLCPLTPSDLSDDDTIKIGEYTSIKVKIEIHGGSQLRRNLRRGAATGAKDGDQDAMSVVAENRSRRGGAKPNLASVSENRELGLETGEELGNAVEVVVENQKRRGRPRKARVLKNEPQESFCEVEKLEEIDNVGPIEPKQGRQVSSRRTRSSKKEENLNSDSTLPKISESSGLDITECREPESAAPVDNNKDKRTRGGMGRKKNLQDEPLESVENEVLKGKNVAEGLNLGPEGRKEVDSMSGDKKNLPNWPIEAVHVDVPDEEGVEESNLGQEGCEKLTSTSGVKVSGVGVRDELDLEKMTLGEWFDYLEVYLPKQIRDATEEMISSMRQRAEQFHDFMLQQTNLREKDELPIGLS
ncbi:hypothetical protein F0562_000455 [Nyssa sinensis]|uniref:FHA domain-containing protein n=1 Tax=Nyssa sinensis TaxID=561372 RepID=A0A5J5C599_9ASTE|nr:hypothetical protein F0562_000455 [Nyssa sinensis]